MVKIKVGLILPPGFIALGALKNPIDKHVTTVYGDVNVIECEVGDIPCAYVMRAGKPLDMQNACKVNYRANVWALKDNGCSHIIGVNIDGSLKEDISIGSIVILNDFYDQYDTSGREKCFHDGEFGSPKGAVLVPMTPTFNPHIRQCIINAAKQSNIDIVPEGKAVVTDGVAFPTNTELMVYDTYNANFINTTICPEATLTKEAGMLYIGISIVTFNASQKSTWPELLKAALNKKDTVEELLKASISVIGKEKWEKDFLELQRDIAVDTDRSCKCRI